VYLGVAPVLPGAAGPCVGPPAAALDPRGLEHCVVMRRLPDGRDALSLLERGELGPEHVDAIARRLCEFHRAVGLGAPPPFSSEEWLERLSGPVEENLEVLARARAVVPGEAVQALRAQARARLQRDRERFLVRWREGRIVDGHGDVHLPHVWFEREGEPPLLIDCIEFGERLRWIDAASEVAFLAMDLRHRGRADLSRRLLRRYAALRDDFGLYTVCDYYLSYRAGVRAKVAAMAAGQPEIAGEQRERSARDACGYLELAARLLARPPDRLLILLCGVVGTGKSSAAERIADLRDGAVVRSDRVRKQLAGLEPTARGGAAAGIYSHTWTDRVYAGLRERAARILDGGRAAILDATFARAAFRADAIAFARGLGVPCWIVETRCDAALVRERLEARSREGSDPSDAGPDFHAASAAEFEPVGPGEADRHLVIRTDLESWSEQLPAQLEPS
jgi:aminoglycoside phosphotransferase family enzyme/predicted kinase